jgi:hypothetical protein
MSESVDDGWVKLKEPSLAPNRDLLAYGVEGPRGFNELPSAD